MSRLTVRLPESLHQALAHRAQAEGVSLNQLIVYQLARMTTAADLEEQRRIFEDLRRRYPPQEAEEALQKLLAARTPPPSRASAGSWP
jgi:acyl-CoA hydrolase